MNYLIIKATTNSIWDNCNFAIIPIDQSAIDYWQKIAKVSSNIPKELSLEYTGGSITLYEDYANYFADSSELPEGMEEELEQAECCWIIKELSEESIEGFTLPESRLDCECLRVDFDGEIKFVAHGKHTGEEYWTEGVNLKDLNETFKTPSHA